jgi:enolase-phosphatase E1
VTRSFAERGVAAVLLDIEGTTTPIAFVHDVLFPYARRHLGPHLNRVKSSAELAEVVSLLQAEHARDRASNDQPPEWNTAGEDATVASVERYVRWLMDRDRKSPGLKLLQGHIWEWGYRSGELRGQVFADVPATIKRWRSEGLDVAIYSSGSVLAQRRLFESLPEGDLTPLIAAFFDTGVGAKTAPESYTTICRLLERAPREVLFISDVTRELAAAQAAGVRVLLSIRPGNASQPDEGSYERMRW